MGLKYIAEGLARVKISEAPKGLCSPKKKQENIEITPGSESQIRIIQKKPSEEFNMSTLNFELNNIGEYGAQSLSETFKFLKNLQIISKSLIRLKMESYWR